MNELLEWNIQNDTVAGQNAQKTFEEQQKEKENIEN